MVLLCAPYGSTKVRIVAFEIPGLHQEGLQGVYDRVIQKILLKDNLATLEVYPPARADNNFADCNNCCITPANDDVEFYQYRPKVLTTLPLNTARLYIFVPPGEKPISRLAELKGKVVGTRFGMPYGKTFDTTGIESLEVSELKEHLDLLARGHIDAFMAYAPDIYEMFRSEGIEPFPHTRDTPYAIHPDSLVCRGVSDEFIETFNSRLRTLSDSGELEEILGGQYLEPISPLKP